MRKLMILTLLVLSFATSALAIPLTNTANKHNLSSNSLNNVRASTDTRICVFCHTPHGASPQSALWNRKDPSTASFPLYASNTVDIKDIVAAQYNNSNPATYPNGATRMCLSCHDGVSAVGEVLSGLENFTSRIAMTYDTLNAAGGSAVIDLSTSHPVSFVYSATVKDAINVAEGVGADVHYRLPSIVPLDSADRMQCTTCHDPHEDTNNGTTYTLPFWRNYTGSTAAAELADYDNTCQDCHRGSDWGGSWGGAPAPIH